MLAATYRRGNNRPHIYILYQHRDRKVSNIPNLISFLLQRSRDHNSALDEDEMQTK